MQTIKMNHENKARRIFHNMTLTMNIFHFGFYVCFFEEKLDAVTVHTTAFILEKSHCLY